eukprot:293835-Pleurochrysis_carterae.AAC.5
MLVCARAPRPRIRPAANECARAESPAVGHRGDNRREQAHYPAGPIYCPFYSSYTLSSRSMSRQTRPLPPASAPSPPK